MGDDGNHLARQEEGDQNSKDDCIQKRNGKSNDETQHLGYLGQPEQDDGVGDQMWLCKTYGAT